MLDSFTDLRHLKVGTVKDRLDFEVDELFGVLTGQPSVRAIHAELDGVSMHATHLSRT